MAYLGLVPSEHSSGPKRRIGGITKSGDIHARTLLIEAAHSYRFPARITRHKLAVVDAVPEAVRAIAWKAQTRLCQRYRQMMAKGKPKPVVVTAIARELAGFVWSIACITSDPPAKSSAATTTSNEVNAPKSTGRSRTARPQQTPAPTELRYVTGVKPAAQSPTTRNPKVSTTPTSGARRSTAASAGESTG
jgi:hypothetical protein